MKWLQENNLTLGTLIFPLLLQYLADYNMAICE